MLGCVATQSPDVGMCDKSEKCNEARFWFNLEKAIEALPPCPYCPPEINHRSEDVEDFEDCYYEYGHDKYEDEDDE